jgi:hypothetical protein
MWVDVNKVVSEWACPECPYHSRWSFADVAECGTPVCANCDIEMELQDQVEIYP